MTYLLYIIILGASYRHGRYALRAGLCGLLIPSPTEDGGALKLPEGGRIRPLVRPLYVLALFHIAEIIDLRKLDQTKGKKEYWRAHIRSAALLLVLERLNDIGYDTSRMIQKRIFEKEN